MTVAAKDRPLEKVKEEVIDQLILNYSHGELSAEAFERRLDKAYELTCQEALLTLVADLPLQSDPRYHSEKAARMRPTFCAANEGANEITIKSILSSDHRGGEWIVPKHMQIEVYAGSVELDFTRAMFASQDVVIEVNGWLWSLEITVPSGIDVTTQTTNILGSVSNNRKYYGNVGVDKQRPRIHVVGKNILGSIEISEKITMKEQLKSFADAMKTLFSDDGSKSKSRY
ncbi:hypothetical protein PALB_35150 [Pseudoalteromonas luteoviolacea B = ATCC 29581]|nr:hypothetical protein PALB_35150 [Pseudoalteromonas luteoviolacea B = ATCC 29581]